MGPLNPESVAAYPNRLATNRNSAYSPPLWAKGLAAGLPGFNTSQCSSGITAVLDPESGKSPGLKERTRRGGGVLGPGETKESKEAKEAEELFARIKQFAFAGQSGTATVPAPGCTQQAPLNSIYGPGTASTYQHAFEQTGKP